jgi:hypothetical protein
MVVVAALKPANAIRQGCCAQFLPFVVAQFHGLVPGLGAWQNIRCRVVKTREAVSVVASTVPPMTHAGVVAASDPDVDRNLVFVENKFQGRARRAVDVFQTTTGMTR